ncbi:MAG TPA: adenosylmethionine--8-amino-7-oxononanoate transaminase [Actinomycetota bacterium]|jgi:adenosylmethionine-8-amino-7-oxononanoate transaminase/8-amino-7-oxononanoate synthase
MSRSWVDRDAARVWHGFTQMASYAGNLPVIVERAEGNELVDVDGRRYLDAISSLWVSTLGHRVPELDAALVEQVGRVAHSTLLGNGNRVVVELAEALAEVVPVDDPHFLFASDGAAAVEQALKLAFQFWANEGVRGRTSYLAFGDAYHGDTVGSLSLGGGGFGTDLFDPLRFPVLRAPGFDRPDCFEVAARLVEEHAEELAAVVVEPLVQGAAGMHTAPPEAFGVLAGACRRGDVLLVCDEVATGFGRTGALFASERCGLRPDLLCLGKGLAAGYLPMSVTVASGRVHQAFLGEDLGPRTFYHGHSFAGNALAAAVALRHLRLLAERDVLAGVRARSAELRALLAERVAPLPAVAEVRLEGLMGGVELHAGQPGARRGRRVCAAAVARGVLLRPLGDVVVLMPPLTVTRAELERLVEALRAAIVEVAPEPDGPVAAEGGRAATDPVARPASPGGPGGVLSASPGDRSAPVDRAEAPAAWRAWAAAECRAIGDADRWRSVRTLDLHGPAGPVELDGRRLVSFAGNDYLGLSVHPAVVGAAHRALDRWGAGSGAARLVTGARPVHAELEAELADWKGTGSALLFPTGYAANLGVLTTFGGRGALVHSDELNHASIVDGCRLSRAEVAVYPHRDLEVLERRLAEGAGRRQLVVSDLVFSMDGDLAPLDGLVALCARHGALLVLDEAHAVLGPHRIPPGAEVVRVGTLSKALGALGGFAACDAELAGLLVNRARPFVFTTAGTPADAAAALAALRVLRSAEGEALLGRLRRRVDLLAPGHPSPIVPVLLGSERDAVDAAARLAGEGFLVPAIRPPSVPAGTSRLRVTVSAAHTEEQVRGLAAALRALGAAMPAA